LGDLEEPEGLGASFSTSSVSFFSVGEQADHNSAQFGINESIGRVGRVCGMGKLRNEECAYPIAGVLKVLRLSDINFS